MAERKKIKYKQKELDFTDLMYNIGNNLTKYQEHEKFNEDLLNEFNAAYKSYIDLWKANPENIYINDMGLFVGPGVMVTKNFYYNSDGNKINQDEYDKLNSNKLKKYKKFNAGEEVVRYFNIIGNSSKEYEEPKKASFSDNDFWTEWRKEYDPDGGEYNTFSFVNQDAYDETTGKRLRTNRKSKISEFLNNYINKDFSNVDFSTTSFKSSDDYVKALNSFKEILNNESSDWNDITIAALKAGIGLDMFNYMMSDQKDPGKSPEEIEAERLAKEEALKKADAEQAKLDAENTAKKKKEEWDLHVKNLWDLWESNKKSYSGFYYDNGYKQQPYYDKDGYVYNSDWVKTVYNKQNPTSQEIAGTLEDYIKNPGLSSDPGYHYLNYTVLGPERDKYTRLDDGFYYIPDIERHDDNGNPLHRESKGIAMLYNPSTALIIYKFIGDVPGLLNKMLSEWSNTYDGKVGYKKYLKQGGIIKFLFGGKSFEQLLREEATLRAKQQGKKNIDELLKEEKEGLSGAEWARILAAGADLASFGAALAPGAGTVISGVAGVGSTLTNFGADIFDGTGVEWRDLGNLAYGLGADVVGLIPGIGGAGKTAKIIKNLKKVAPTVLMILGGVSLLEQAPEMILAWSKVGKERLTREDINLMSQSIEFLLGTSSAVGKTVKMSNINLLGDDKIAVTFLDRNGSKKTVMFKGDDANKIRTATDKVAAAKEVGNQYKDLRDLSVSTHTVKEKNWHRADESKSRLNLSNWRFSETKEQPLIQNVEVLAPKGKSENAGFYVFENNKYIKAKSPGKKYTPNTQNTQRTDNFENEDLYFMSVYKQGGSLDLKKIRKGYLGLSLLSTLPNKQKTYEEVRREINSLNFDEHLNQVLDSMSDPPKNFFGSSSLKENGLSTGSVNSATRDPNNEQNSKSFDAKLGNLFGDIDYNALNFVANNFFNKKIYDEHLSAQIPNLESYDNRPTSVIMGNDADIQGRLAAEQLSFSKPISSDINVNTADRLSRTVQGVNLINQGNLNYDASVKDSYDRIAQELLRYYDINREIANKNRNSLLQTSSNKSNIYIGYYASLYHNLDRFLKERQTKQKEQLLLENSFIEQEIDNSVRYNLEKLAEKYRSDITKDELAIYNKVLVEGTLPANLSEEESKLFRSAMLKAQDIKTQMLKKQINVPNGYYSDLAKYNGIFTLFDPEMSYGTPVKFGKSGGKLSNDNIKLFYKQLKEESKKHEKRLNKLEKNMYRLKNSK